MATKNRLPTIFAEDWRGLFPHFPAVVVCGMVHASSNTPAISYNTSTLPPDDNTFNKIFTSSK
eukprot:scaffold7495_cov158-Amphora_coffeaeformis.AAC.1